ncbi:hypothetical protein [Collimonas pratensis]|uniref:hypothetical protein n=1 Tax=Collimonas pratensis TaxID=279113 RepID=UPI000AFC36BF|nr:hypothetical protein [Collimonas pratensis]
MKITIAHKEALFGAAKDITIDLVNQLKGGSYSPNAIWESLKVILLSRMTKHCYAAMRRHGFEIADDELPTKQVLTREISRKTGIEFSDITNHEAVISDIDKHVTNKINVALSTNLVSVMDQAALKSGIVDVIVAQVGAGGIGAVMNGARANMLRSGIVYAVAFEGKQTFNVSTEHRKMMQRIYQRRYRRTHKKVWID